MLHLYENRPEMTHYYITYARVEQITKRYSQREGKREVLLKKQTKNRFLQDKNT